MREYDYPEHYAANIHDAISLAEELKASGKYDLFRGQTERFPLRPTAFRDGVDRNAVVKKLDDFTSWVHNTPDLSSLHNNIPAIVAVAQHYGLKTTYLDFSYSPKVAGFFATDGAIPENVGTLICVNKERFIKSWADLNKSYAEREEGRILTDIIEINVQNLWRLQAQKGVFLDCRVDPTMLEMFSFFLHIYFPQTEVAPLIERSIIYPTEKSHLEIFLDKYSLISTYPQREADLLKLFDVKIELKEGAINDEIASYYINENFPDIDKSWKSEFAKTWKIEPNEQFDISTLTKEVIIVIPERDEHVSFEDQIEKAVSQEINLSGGEVRPKLKWKIQFLSGDAVLIDSDGSPSKERSEWTIYTMAEMVAAIYAGMRYLPYTNSQIIRAITRYITISFFGVYKVIDETYGVEFSGGAIRGRGFCNATTLKSALRDDFYDHIKPNYLPLNTRDIIFTTNLIQRSYNFEKFINLFVEDLIPTQACVSIENLVMNFNPMSIEAFGES